MAKTLIIKGANFTVNKLDTVSFDVVPCTGISFDSASDNANYGEAYTVNYTVSPADTTDQIIWSSNNEDFVVSDGVVSVNGVGQATITASCGSYSASMVLTSTATFSADDFDSADNMGMDFTNDYGSLIKGNSRFTLGRVSSTGYHSAWSDAETQQVGLTFCPCLIPHGSTSMTIAYSASYGTKVGFADLDLQASIGLGCVKIIDHDSSSTAAASRTLTIPEDAGGFYIAVYNSDKTLLSITFA